MIQDFYVRLHYYLKSKILALVGAYIINILYRLNYLMRKCLRKRKIVDVDYGKSLESIKSVYCNNNVKEITKIEKDIKLDLSIIVPVYNGETFLEENIRACLSQITEYNYEIIYVNDGSTDETANILKKYENNPKMKVIHKENGGSASARNKGIEISCGRYLMFVDCDDLIHNDMVEKMLNTAYLDDNDIVMCSHNLVKYYKGKVESTIPYIYSKINLLNYCKKGKIFNYPGFPWGKVYKRELFDSVRFPEGYWYEDTIIHMLVYLQCGKFQYIDDILYDYRLNENSITNTVSNSINPKVIDRYWIIENIEYQYKALNLECDDVFYMLLLKHLSAYYYKDIKLLDKGYVENLFVVAKKILNRYKVSNKMKLPFMLKQVEQAFEKNDIELWKLASSYQ